MRKDHSIFRIDLHQLHHTVRTRHQETDLQETAA